MNSREEVARPLVVRMGALGDMVMLTPLLKALYERTGLAADLVACGEWNRTLFAQSPWVNQIYTVQSRNTPFWFSPSKQAMVRQLKPYAANRPWFLFEHLPDLHRLMYRAHCDKALATLATTHPRQLGEHTCEHFLRMADVTYPPSAAQLHCSAADIDECKAWLSETKKIDRRIHKVVMLQAGNKRTMRKGKRDRASNRKYWPEQQWASLIDRIVATEPNTKILLCGAPSEVDLVADIAALCQPSSQQNIVQCAADLPLSRLMALASLADACISVDTGPAHIAAALGCPLVVLFGQTDARQFRPLGVNDVRIVAHKNWQTFGESAAQWAAQNTMNDIRIEQVLSAYLQLQARQPITSAFAMHSSTSAMAPSAAQSAAAQSAAAPIELQEETAMPMRFSMAS